MNASVRKAAEDLFESTGDIGQVLDMLSQFAATTTRTVDAIVTSVQSQLAEVAAQLSAVRSDET